MLTHARVSKIAGIAAIIPAIAVVGATSAAADPYPGSQRADETINALTAQGYTVAINWIGDISPLPLSRCRVNAIHDPNRGVPALPKSSVTVYVDVQCPDSGTYS